MPQGRSLRVHEAARVTTVAGNEVTRSRRHRSEGMAEGNPGEGISAGQRSAGSSLVVSVPSFVSSFLLGANGAGALVPCLTIPGNTKYQPPSQTSPRAS